jgi:hypothetical protein
MVDSNLNTGAAGKTDLSISMEKANVYSLAFALPIAGLLAVIYILRWGGGQFAAGFNSLFENFIIFLVVFFLGIVLHELIHGLAWMLFGRKSFHAIKFGFQVKTFTPYAHCLEPMKVNPYRIGTVMPGLVLGFFPALTGIITGNGWLTAFGLLFITAAGGDFLILWLIRDVDSDKLVEDHPTRAGCYVLDDPSPKLEPE